MASREFLVFDLDTGGFEAALECSSTKIQSVFIPIAGIEVGEAKGAERLALLFDAADGIA